MSAKKKMMRMSGYLKKMKKINEKMLLVANTAFGVDTAIMNSIFRKITDTEFPVTMWADFEYSSRYWLRRELFKHGLDETDRVKVCTGHRKVKIEGVPGYEQVPIYKIGYGKWTPGTFKILDSSQVLVEPELR